MIPPVVHIGTDARVSPLCPQWQEMPVVRAGASIIIPVHNLGDGVGALLAVLGDTDLEGCEVIVVDDGSTDQTWEALLAWGGCGVRSLLVRFVDNSGVAAVRNWAVQASRADYLWFVDGDDSWPSDGLQKLLTPVREPRSPEMIPDVVFGQAVRIVDGSGRRVPVPSPAEARILTHNDMVTGFVTGQIQGHLWNKLLRRSLFKTDVFPAIRSKSDACGVAELIGSAVIGVAISDEVYQYRFHGGSIATSNPPLLDLVHVLECTLREFGDEPIDPRLFQVFYVRCFAILALTEAWRSGTRGVALRYINSLCRGLMPLTGAVTLLRLGERRLAAFVVAYRLFPGVVRSLYVNTRKHEW